MRATAVRNVTEASEALSGDHDYNIWVLMRQTRDAMTRARERELEKAGISSIQAAVLFTIQAIGPESTPAEISRRLVREPHSVSGLLSRMEKQGLIKRVRDLPKRNMVRVVMTAKGQRAYEQSTQRRAMHDIMGVLSEAERKELWSYLETLRARAMQIAGIGHELPFPPPFEDG